MQFSNNATGSLSHYPTLSIGCPAGEVSFVASLAV